MHQGELARPPIVRQHFNIWDEDIEFFSENRKRSNADRNVVTDATRSANSQILPLNAAHQNLPCYLLTY